MDPLLFLSHAGEDSGAARELAGILREAGLSVWLDVEELKPGDAWMPSLEAALRKADAFAVYVGRSGVSHWVDREVRVALDRNTREPDFRILPILGPGADPEVMPAFLSQHQWLDLRTGYDDPIRLQELVAAVLETEAAAVSMLPPDVAPFRGLLRFDVEHAALFFGRDRETEELLGKLAAAPFLAVVGDSGSGKSSLVRAGLVPALHRGRFGDGKGPPGSWKVAILRPGDDPFRELADALVGLDSGSSPAQRIEVRAAAAKQLAEGTSGLRDVVAALVPPDARTLLVVDQLEELFTLTAAHEDRRRFLDSVFQAVDGEGDRPVYAVVTLRADFYSHCWEHPQLPERVARSQCVVRRMDQEQLREVIEKPLALAGARLEAGLLDAILRDVGDQAGNLALLEHALERLWQQPRPGGLLTHAAYQRIGRVVGALKHHADQIYDQLSEPPYQEADQALARKIFERLTQLGQDTVDTRRSAPKKELLALGGDPAALERVLRTLAEQRLVTVAGQLGDGGAREESDGESQVEVAHEALIREWPRLRAWIEADREALRTERRLMAAAAEWLELGRDADLLYRGARLAEAEEWAEAHADDFTAEMKSFFEASLEARDRAAREAEIRRRRELRAARRLAAVLASASVLVLAAAGVAWLQRDAAQKARKVAESRELAASSVSQLRVDPELAVLLASAAARVSPTVQAEESLRQALVASVLRFRLDVPEGPCSTTAFSPDGRFVAAAACDGTAAVWDLGARERAATLDGGIGNLYREPFSFDGRFLATGDERLTATQVWDLGTSRRLGVLDGPLLAFSPDGDHVVTGSQEGPARVWQISTGREVELIGHGDRVTAAAFSPDGTLVATGGGCEYGVECRDTTVRIWEAETGRARSVMSGHTKSVLSAVFSPDGRWLVTLDQYGQARVWHAGTGDAVAVLDGLSGSLTAASFSPDGKLLVAGSSKGEPKVWNTSTWQSEVTLAGHTDRVSHTVFGHHAQFIVTASEDRTARVWEAATGQPVEVLRGHSGAVENAAFSLDDRWVVTSGRCQSTGDCDRTVRLWEVVPQRVTARLDGHTGPIWRAAFSPDGALVVTASATRQAQGRRSDLTARVWDANTGESIAVLRGHAGDVLDAAFSPDGGCVVTASADATARVWEAATGRPAAELRGHSGPVQTAAFGPDGRQVVTASADKTARVWEAATGKPVAELQGHTASVRTAAFSPDGRRVVTASTDKTARVWEAATGKLVAELSGNAWFVNSAAFSPDGQRVVTAGEDGTARVWEAATGARVGELDSHTGAVVRASFSPDGRFVVTASSDRTARVWEIERGQSVELRGHSGRVIDARFSPDGKFVVTASEDQTARVWEARSGRLLITLQGHTDAVRSTAFGPDGKLVVTAGDDATALIHTCEVCGTVEDLLTLADARVTRALTPGERERFLHEHRRQ